MTNTTVPPLPSDCTVVTAQRCWASIFWELDFNRTFLEFRDRPGMASNAPPRDMVTVRIVKGMERNNQTLSSGREVNYECDSSDKCNGQAGLQKLLSSLSVEDQFQQELAPLLKIISPFDARAADCLYFHNTTFRCPPPDLRRCHRCTVEAAQLTSPTEYACATCEVDESRDNFVERFKTFVLSNPKEDIDVAILGCQLEGCNTVDNANLVYKASQITFNSDAYFKK
ncbi:unnamed protein product [Rotaria socialis]|nr:unnamed protein product [Rotaria socialis]CAF3370467.1 unnamed protein product [Rotaria socialis]CAF3448368.1 unnamed protein product [Rotaria socialis]CAF3521412.1 unnamed protein product [Rotaria socialis]CAF4312565.1 unnamed protein product [Rotaria socialis]